MRTALSLPFLLILGSISVADDRGLRFTTAHNNLPALKSIVVTKAREPGPGAAKHKAVAEIASYKESLKVPGEGQYDIWWQGKTGNAVRVLSNVKWKDGEVKEIELDSYLGVVNIRGDNLPRAALVSITSQDDPGPGEKGHAAIQTAKDYRVDMVVPAGNYSLWITPDNGAQPRKINDRFRVQAGKTVQLD